MERRERDRVNVRLQCRIGAPGLPEAGPCNVTENISRTGILIRWEQDRSAAPAVGDCVEVKLKLPANPMFGQRWMLFQAQVVRVSQAAGESLMVAVAGSPVRFSSVVSIDGPSPSAYLN
jgi:hypothetical protein